jgi:tRNA(Ile)-lysidine synthase
MPLTVRLPAIGEDLATRFRRDLARLGVTGGTALSVAVSGGPDSLALLLLCRMVHDGPLAAATVDHGLRADAAGEARAVGDICAAIGVPHATLTVAVAASGAGLQAAARDARYAALADWCAARGIEKIATAHHADDQAETLLMRLNRGAGLSGLAGVRAERALGDDLTVVRPLLGWRKSALAAIVAEAGLAPADDPSNRDLRHDRTAIRALLDANPLLDATRIAASAAHLADSEAALAWTTQAVLDQRVSQGADGMCLDPDDLPTEVLRRAVTEILSDFNVMPDGPAVMTMIDRLREGTPATLGDVKATPGDRWTFAPAPPRREKQ